MITSRPFEKCAMDIIWLDKEKKYVLLIVNYFTRGFKVIIVDNEDSIIIIKSIKGWLNRGIKIREIITDNRKEFTN